ADQADHHPAPRGHAGRAGLRLSPPPPRTTPAAAVPLPRCARSRGTAAAAFAGLLQAGKRGHRTGVDDAVGPADRVERIGPGGKEKRDAVVGVQPSARFSSARTHLPTGTRSTVTLSARARTISRPCRPTRSGSRGNTRGRVTLLSKTVTTSEVSVPSSSRM